MRRRGEIVHDAGIHPSVEGKAGAELVPNVWGRKHQDT